MDIFSGPLVCSQAIIIIIIKEPRKEFEINVLKFNIEKRKKLSYMSLGKKSTN